MSKVTFRQFNQLTAALQHQRFDGTDCDPLLHGIHRADFEEQKLKQLIKIAVKVSSPTAQRKKEMWERMLARVQSNRARMEKLRSEISGKV